MSKKEGRIYLCDPEKNTECKKTGCYIHGGWCSHTRHPEFAKEEPEEKTGCNGDSCPIGGAHASGDGVERLD